MTTPKPTKQMASSRPSLNTDIEALNPRSVVLSVLLGSHPPVLPANAISSFCSLFGFRSGTTRTALSRMVSKQDLVQDGTTYRLGSIHLARQRSQDSGRTRVSASWDGDWIIVAAIAERRTMAERRVFRSSMLDARMGELRPETWVRPANIEPILDTAGLFVGRGSTGHEDPVELVHRLWPLAEYDKQTRSLLERLEQSTPTVVGALETGNFDTIPDAFGLSAEVVHFLRQEPQLPPELHLGASAVDELREFYDDYEFRFRQLLQSFFRSA